MQINLNEPPNPNLPAVALPADAPAELQTHYIAQKAAQNSARRAASGLPQMAPAAVEGAAALDPFAEISTCFGQASLSAYLNDNPTLLLEQSDQIQARAKEWNKAAVKRDRFLGKARPHLTQAGTPVAEKCTQAVEAQATDLSKKAAKLKQGESILISGRYGNNKSTVGGLLSLSQHVLGKNVQALPTPLRDAFGKGKVATSDILKGLFAIVTEKGDNWQQDPVAQRILSLCPANKRTAFIAYVEDKKLHPIEEQTPTALSDVPDHFIAQDLDLNDLIVDDHLRVLLEHAAPETPARKLVVDTLFQIVQTKGKTWQEDATVKHILQLCPENRRAELIKFVEDNRLACSIFNARTKAFIPQDLSHDTLLERLVPTDENGVFSLIEMVLPPSVAEQFKKAATAPRTTEDLLRPFLGEIYKHLHAQVPSGTGEEIAVALKGILKNWQDSKTKQLASYFIDSDTLTKSLVTHWNSLQVANAAGPEAFFDTLGRIAFELSGSPHADLASLLRSIVDENVEYTLNEILKTMPADVRELCQGALLSPTGDLHTKCIYAGKDASGKKLYDVEIYATGPLMDAAHFKGKWPIQFKGIKQEQLSKDFFKCLLQHTLAAEEKTPFTSSPELVQQFLFNTLGKEKLEKTGPTLPNTRLSAQEKTFYYSVSTHETSTADEHNPAVRMLTWQHAQLKKLATQQLQNQQQEVAKLVFANADTAKAMQDAAGQLLAQAESMKDKSPLVQSNIAEIRALCQEIQFAANETWQRLAEAHFQRAIDAPTPVEVPAWLTATLKPHYAKFKASMDSAQRVLKYLPISKSWKESVRKQVLQQAFHVTPENLDKVYTQLEATLGSSNIATPKTGLSAKISNLFDKATKAIGFLFVKVYEAVRFCIARAIAALPESAQISLQQMQITINQAVDKIMTRIRDAIVGALVKMFVSQFVNDTLSRYTSAFAHYALGSMQPDGELNLKINETTPNGYHPAADFAAELAPLLHFAPLSEIAVNVLDGAITHLTLPGIEEHLIIRTNEGGESFAVYKDNTGKEWIVSKKQNDPKLAAFRPYLILEDDAGNKRVLLRDVLVTDKMVETICEKKFGEALWNMVKGFMPQTAKENVFYTCSLTDQGLTSQDPDALLYMMHSHLIRNDEKAAYTAFKEFEKVVGEDATRIPANLAERLLPFALCVGPTATQIRLSLFATAEKQRQNNPLAAGKDNALQSAMWALIAADAMMAEKNDPRFTANEEQTNLLRQAMKTRMQQHLPFYTAKDMRHILGYLLNVDGAELPEKMDFAVAKGRDYLTNNIDSVVSTLIPGQAPVAVIAPEPAAEPTVLQKATQSAIAGAREEFPQLLHRMQEASHNKLTETEKEMLTALFTLNPPVMTAYNTQIDQLPQEGLSVTTVKTHFWQYYDVCLNASLNNDHRADGLIAQIAILQQEAASDPAAAVLARVLAHLIRLGREGADPMLAFAGINSLAGDTPERVTGYLDLILNRSTEEGRPDSAGALSIGANLLYAAAAPAVNVVATAAGNATLNAARTAGKVAVVSVATLAAGGIMAGTIVTGVTIALVGVAGGVAGATIAGGTAATAFATGKALDAIEASKNVPRVIGDAAAAGILIAGTAPILVVGGAVVATGAVVGGTILAGAKAAEVTYSAGSAVANTVSDATGKAVGAVTDAKDKVVHTVSQAKDSVVGAITTVADKTTAATNKALSTMSNVVSVAPVASLPPVNKHRAQLKQRRRSPTSYY